MDNIFSERLISARQKAGLSQKNAAKAIGITPVTLNRYEKGHREPERELLIKIAELYNCDVTWLLTGEGNKIVRETPPQPDNIPRLSDRQLEAARLIGVLSDEEQDEMIANMKKQIIEKLSETKK